MSRPIPLAVVAALTVVLGHSLALAQYGPDKAQMPGKTDPALTKLAKEWEAAFNAKDVAKVASMYTEDAVVMPPNHEPVRGRANIEAFFKEMANGAKLTLTPFESAMSGATAYEAGTYQMSMTSKTGPPITDKGKNVVILKRGSNGQWRLAHDIFNSDLPPPGTK
jgi:uncharacterized protein (TIGR02246 family)